MRACAGGKGGVGHPSGCTHELKASAAQSTTWSVCWLNGCRRRTVFVRVPAHTNNRQQLPSLVLADSAMADRPLAAAYPAA